jgi:uncharacterized protein
VTEQCNLGCTYCYARRSARTMSGEVADAAVDLLFSDARGEPRVNLSFYGGEPFLEPDLMLRVLERARRAAAPGQTVRCVTPTNGLHLGPEALALCREFDLELALSLDSTRGSVERVLRDGSDSTAAVLAAVPALLPHAKTARITVTPQNVGELSANVKGVARLGFARVVYQPAWELDWGADALDAWRREHDRILTWAMGAPAAGQRVPDLPNLTSIEARLLRGTPRRACGAGTHACAVAADGSLFPCYRFVFQEDLRLGHVSSGFGEPSLRDRFAALGPEDQRPQSGKCTDCPAHDGCTHFCPALGYLLGGDLRAVPEVVCALTRPQVEAVRSAFC